MSNKPVSLFDYYAQNPQQFVFKKIYSRFCIIFWLPIIIAGFFINPVISMIGTFLFIIFLLTSRRSYYYDLSTNNKIVSVLEEKFPNYLMSKDDILDCFLNKRFVSLLQLLNAPENQDHANHDEPIYQEDIDSLDEKERSYFDSIYIEIDEQENAEKYYCLLRQERSHYKHGDDVAVELTDVMVLTGGDYRSLKKLLKPAKDKNKKRSSIVS